MPAFGRQLSDAQLAALANYVTRQFGDPATPALTADEIAKRRMPQ
ncbi:c-type cytochrome, partial [Ralstonia pseudosolanacearum]